MLDLTVITDTFARFGALSAEELRITGVFPPHIGDWLTIPHPQPLTTEVIENWARVGIPSVMVGFGAINTVFTIAELTTN